MKIVLEENEDPIPYRFCFVCGDQYETSSIMAVAYTSQGNRMARICTNCIKAGPDGIKGRARAYAERLKRLAERAERITQTFDQQAIEMPTIEELEERQKVNSSRY